MRGTVSVQFLLAGLLVACCVSVGVCQPAPATAGPAELGDPSWGFKFTVPQGWQSATSYQGALLGNGAGGIIIVCWHSIPDLQQLGQYMSQPLQQGGLTLYLSTQLRAVGENVLRGEYVGFLEGQQLRAVGYGTISPHGGGALILAGGPASAFTAQLAAAADGIVQSLKYFNVSTSDLARHFAGTWNSVDMHTDATIVLTPDGSFYDSRTTTNSEILRDAWTQRPDGGWAVQSNTKAAGKWTVKGTPAQGQFLVTLADGTQFTVDYTVHAENGKPFWNIYRFNGMLYQKQ